MAGRVVFEYKAALEWDGRVMTIVAEGVDQLWLDHWEWYRDEGRREAGRAAKVWLPSGSYDGQPAREWYLRNDQVLAVHVERELAPVAVQDGLFGEAPAA